MDNEYAHGEYQRQEPTRPNNYIAMNIIATAVGILGCGTCCVSFFIGIVGIIFSTQVTSRFNSGDIAGAESSARTAKILGIASLVIIGLTFLLYIYRYVSLGGIEGVMEESRRMQELYNL